MAIRPYVIIAVALCVAGGLGFVGGLRTGLSKSGARVQELQIQAAQAKGGEDAAKVQADQAREDAQAWADRALDAGKRIEALKAKLASLHVAVPNPTGSVEQLPNPGPGLGGALADLVQQTELKDQIIQAQDVKIVALEGQVSAQGEQIKGLEKALFLADRRADILAQALKAKRRVVGWSVSGGYGTDRTITAGVERGVAGPLSAGVGMVKRVLPAGNSTIEAVCYIRWSF